MDETQSGIEISGRNISNLRHADDILWQNVKRNWRSSWWQWNWGVKKTGLKLSIQKTKIMASGPITSWQINGETMETVKDFIFLGSKIIATGDSSHEMKRHLLLGRKTMKNLDRVFKSRDITLPIKAHIVKAMVFQQSCTDMRAEPSSKLSIEVVTSNCHAGEDFWQSLGLQGDQASQS